MIMKKGDGRLLFLIMVGKVIWTKVPTEKYENVGYIFKLKKFLDFLKSTKQLKREKRTISPRSLVKGKCREIADY